MCATMLCLLTWSVCLKLRSSSVQGTHFTNKANCRACVCCVGSLVCFRPAFSFGPLAGWKDRPAFMVISPWSTALDPSVKTEGNELGYISCSACRDNYCSAICLEKLLICKTHYLLSQHICLYQTEEAEGASVRPSLPMWKKRRSLQ